MKIIYVLKNAGMCGGHKVVMEHLNGLARRSHECELVHLQAEPNWFEDIQFKCTKLNTVEELIEYLKSIECIKVATWWETAEWVAQGGGQYYLVQDIETSYSKDPGYRQKVLDSYQLGMTHIVENSFQYAALKYLAGVEVERISIGIDHKIFRPRDIPKNIKSAIFFYRPGANKNAKMLEDAMQIIKQIIPDFELYTYGAAPCPFSINNLNITDYQLADLMNRAGMLISTSVHEGFCLPLLEAMACGTPVISTRAIGNEVFCINRVNSLLVDNSTELAGAIQDLCIDAELPHRFIENGFKTAANYKWDTVIDKLEDIFKIN